MAELARHRRLRWLQAAAVEASTLVLALVPVLVLVPVRVPRRRLAVPTSIVAGLQAVCGTQLATRLHEVGVCSSTTPTRHTPVPLRDCLVHRAAAPYPVPRAGSGGATP